MTALGGGHVSHRFDIRFTAAQLARMAPPAQASGEPRECDGCHRVVPAEALVPSEGTRMICRDAGPCNAIRLAGAA